MLLADCGVAGKPDEGAFVASWGVSDRPTPLGTEPDVSLVFRVSTLMSRAVTSEPGTSCDGDWLVSLESPSNVWSVDVISVGAEVELWRDSFSFRLYLSFSFKDFSRSLFSPNIIALCFSTNRHSCALWLAACCFSASTFFRASSAEPAAAMSEAASCGPWLSCATRSAFA